MRLKERNKIKRVISIGVLLVMFTTQVGATGVERWSEAEYERYEKQIIEGRQENRENYEVAMQTMEALRGEGAGSIPNEIDGVEEEDLLHSLYVGLPKVLESSYGLTKEGRLKEGEEQEEQKEIKIPQLEKEKKVDNLSKGGLNQGKSERLQRTLRASVVEEITKNSVIEPVEIRYPRLSEFKEEKYLPYASMIAISEIQEGMERKSYTEIIEELEEVIEYWEIEESRGEMERHIKAMMSVTEWYRDITMEEKKDIMEYYIHMWGMSSDLDKERSYLNYTYGKGQRYTEAYKNKCLYGYSTVEKYYEAGELESEGDIYISGYRMGEPLFERMMERVELSDIWGKIVIQEEQDFKETLEKYNVGISTVMVGQQTIEDIRDRVEEEQELEEQRRIEEEERKEREAEQARIAAMSIEEVLLERQRASRAGRGDMSGESTYEGLAIKQLEETGQIYKPYRKIETAREKRVEITYFVQTHGEWADETIRDTGRYRSSYRRAACGYTSMAMIISSINEAEEYTPLTLKPVLQYNVSGGNIVVPYVGYSHGGMDWYINNVGLEKEVETSKGGVSYSSGKAITPENVRYLIDNGGIGILSTAGGSPYTAGGHIVLLVGYTEDSEGNFENMIIQDSNLLYNMRGRFRTTYKERINVDTTTGLVYDNYLSGRKSVPVGQMKYASAVFLK